MTRVRLILPLLMVLAPVALAAQATITVSGNVIAKAKADGQLGERFDGYLGAVGAIDPQLQRQLGTINIKRRTLYGAVAAKRGVTRQDVGLAAGCQLLGAVGEGEFYLLGDEQWRQRRAGEAAPRPDYCG